MKIDAKYADDSIVCKYGFTEKLPRRTKEHMKKYNKIKNVDLKLKHHAYIDPQYISEGESDIKDFFGALDIKLEYENDDELVVIKPSLLKTVDRQYKQLSNAYAGHITELIKKVEDLKKENKLTEMKHKLTEEKYKNELTEEKYKNELSEEKHKLTEEKYKNKLLVKDLEISQYKMKAENSELKMKLAEIKK